MEEFQMKLTSDEKPELWKSLFVLIASSIGLSAMGLLFSYLGFTIYGYIWENRLLKPLAILGLSDIWPWILYSLPLIFCAIFFAIVMYIFKKRSFIYALKMLVYSLVASVMIVYLTIETFVFGSLYFYYRVFLKKSNLDFFPFWVFIRLFFIPLLILMLLRLIGGGGQSMRR